MRRTLTDGPPPPAIRRVWPSASPLPCLLAVFAGVAVQATPQPSPPEPALAVVLERSAAYVAEFYRRLSGIAAEEHYVQDWYAERGGERTSLGHRELRSDLVLMKPAASASWTEFRDVFEVDGRAIRSRDDRLEHLLREPAGRASAEVSTIIAESARFNIGDVGRNVNTPLFTLQVSRGRQPGALQVQAERGSRPGPCGLGYRAVGPRLPRVHGGVGDRLRRGRTADDHSFERAEGSAGAWPLLDRAGHRPRPRQRADRA